MSTKPAMAHKPQSDTAHALAQVLADTYVLYLKTHNFHWNVEGADFRSLHQLFEEQYRSLWNSLDGLAERIRALGEYAPGTSAKLRALASLKESEAVPRAESMLRELLEDHTAVVRTIEVALAAAHASADEASAGLLAERLAEHQKQIWMLKSMRTS